MDIPVKKMVRLLQPDQAVETRAAAALVLGEVGVKDGDVARALLNLLSDPDGTVRLNAIRAVGQLKIDKALPVLLELVPHGGDEAIAAADSAARLGAKGVKALEELLHKVVPGVRRYIASALTSRGSDSANASILLDRDPHVAASAASAILNKLPEMTAKSKAALAAELVALTTDRKNPLPMAAEPFVVRVLVGVNDPSTADVLWERVAPPHNHDVRAMALQALGGWSLSPSKEQLRRLFQCASESDFRVAAPAMMILNKLPVNEKHLADWLSLLQAPGAEIRRMVIEKLGDRESATVAEAFMAQVSHPDRVVRDAAVHHLQATKAGRKALVDALLAAEGHDETWQLARTITSFQKDLAPATRTAITDAACKYVESSDHRAEPFLFLLREIDAQALQDQLVERAVALRKKKKYEAALHYLKTAARDPSIGFAVRLELALCGLKVSAKEMAPHARDDDPTLRNFDTLLNLDHDLLLKEVEKAKFLDSEDLFYVGFHFSEQIGRSRQFGIELLKFVVSRDPKSEWGKAAKNKLKSVGA